MTSTATAYNQDDDEYQKTSDDDHSRGRRPQPAKKTIPRRRRPTTTTESYGAYDLRGSLKIPAQRELEGSSEYPDAPDDCSRPGPLLQASESDQDIGLSLEAPPNPGEPTGTRQAECYPNPGMKSRNPF